MAFDAAGVDALGQLTGDPRAHVVGLVDRARLRPGTRHYSPVTYRWADWYASDGGSWAKDLAAGDALGYVILNISSGSGSEQQTDWVTQAARARAAGATVLGYVRTTYGARSHDEVLAEIAHHRDWYAVDGVFLDETVNGWGDQASKVAGYVELAGKIRATYGEAFHIVMNPGSNAVKEIVEAADVVMTFESYASTYLETTAAQITPDFYYAYPTSKFWHVVHNVTQDNYRAVIDRAATLHAGHLYLTDRTFVASSDPQTPAENPYDKPPSSWLIDIQTAWSRGVLATHEAVLDAIQSMTAVQATVADDGNLTLS